MLVFDIFVFLVLFTFAARHLWRIFTTGKPCTVGLFYIIIFIIYGLPITYRYFMPPFGSLGGISHALESSVIHWKHNVVLIVGIILLSLTSINGPASKAKNTFAPMADINWLGFQFFIWIAWFLILTPLLAVLLLAPNKAAYLIYGQTSARGFYSYYSILIQHLVSYLVMIALAGYFLIRAYHYYSSGRLWSIQSIAATFFMAINVYLHGKRTMILLFVLAVGFFQLVEKRRRLFLIIGIPAAVLFFFFYVAVAKPYDIDIKGFVRGDLSRDYTLHFTIAHSHATYNDIMPMRGNSFIWILTSHIPRKYLSSKGWPAPTYFTCAVFGRSIADRLEWGFGVGFFEEFLLNFGYLGLLLFIPLGLCLRFLDHLIYNRSSIYCILWIPLIYNIMFATSAALSMYIGIALPSLLIFRIVMRKEKKHRNEYELDRNYYPSDNFEETTYLNDY